MSRTRKSGKRTRILKSREDRGIQEAHLKSHTFGTTEKVLRRNRKIWDRLANKRRREIDKKAVEDSDEID
jgi:hypothetical protein